MLTLVKKNSSFFIFYLATYFGFLFPFINYDRLHSPAPIDVSFIFYITIYIYWLVLGAIYSHEQMEHKNNGYAFLRNFPISFREIILSKYILVFLSVLIYVVVQYIWLGTLFTDAATVATVRSYLMINASLCLALAGWTYTLIFKFGFGKFGKILFVSWLLLILFPLLMLSVILPKLGLTRKDIIYFLTKTDPLAAFAMALVLFAASYLASLRICGWETNQGH
jgi:hypothetical protein